MLSDNTNLAPCLSLKCENRRRTGISGNGNGNGGNFVVAYSGSIPADTTAGEYVGAEAAGNLDHLDRVANLARLLKNHGPEAARFHDKPAASVTLSRRPCCIAGVGASCLTFRSSSSKLEIGDGGILSAIEGLGECTVDLTPGERAAAATVVQKRRVPGLTYKFDDDFPDVAKPAVIRAFELWEEPLNFTFSWSEDKADIVVGMYSGDHGDGLPFKFGPGGVLAHSTLPPHGDMHFNSDQPWWFGPAPPPEDGQVFDLESVAKHEVGHLLGIEHTDDPKAVMYESIELGETKRGLKDVDVAALKRLYKGDRNFD